MNSCHGTGKPFTTAIIPSKPDYARGSLRMLTFVTGYCRLRQRGVHELLRSRQAFGRKVRRVGQKVSYPLVMNRVGPPRIDRPPPPGRRCS